jgi:DNA-binding cell septation regulator SpoVG
MNTPTLHDFEFIPASRIEQSTGLLGWLKFTIDGTLRVDGVALRRTVTGRLTLAFPNRVSQSGVKRPIVWPPSEEARQAVESQVFEALPIDTGSTS